MFLKQILAQKEIEVAKSKERLPYNELMSRLGQENIILRSFKDRIRQSQTIALIAEIKKASPSKGLLCQTFNPLILAKSYEQSGAAAISVLTDAEFFQGSLDYLLQVKRNTTLTPVLRKDFIIDSYQVAEARFYGADAVLLIVAALKQTDLIQLVSEVQSYGMSPLVEVHNYEELQRAIDAGADIIGINNRNLTTFEVNIQTTYQLMGHMPKGMTLVAESGIKDRADILELEKAGIDAVLVGEAIVTATDPSLKIKKLIGKVS